MLAKMELTDLSKYQTDFIFFTNEVLKLLNEIEEKQKKKENAFRSYHENIFNQQEQKLLSFSNKINELSNIRFIEKSKLQKLDDIDLKQEKIADNLHLNTIRLSTCQKELSNAIYRFDKIFMDNLQIPNLIGEYCKYRNLKEYIQFSSNQMSAILLTKDKHIHELEAQKKYVDDAIKQIQFRTETYLKSAFSYTNNGIKEYDETIKTVVKEIYVEIDDVRIKNNCFVIESKERADELKKELEKVVIIRKEILEKMTGYVEIIDKRNMTIDQSFEQMKKVYENVKELFEDIKGEMIKKQINKVDDLQSDIKDSKQSNYNERVVKELIREEFDNQLNSATFKKKVIDIVIENINSNAKLSSRNNNKELFDDESVLRNNSLFTGVKSKPINNNDAESSVKKYINGEITSSDLSSSKKRSHKSPVINLIRRPSQVSLGENKGTIISDLVLESQRLKDKDDNNNHDDSFLGSIKNKNKEIKQQYTSTKGLIQSISNKDLQDLIKCNPHDNASLSDHKRKSLKSKIEIVCCNDNDISKCKSSELVIHERKLLSKEKSFQCKLSTKVKENNQDNDEKKNKTKAQINNNLLEKKQKSHKKDIQINIDQTNKIKDKALFKEREILGYNTLTKQTREISQENIKGNNHYPHIDSIATSKNIKGSKSETKITLNTDGHQLKYDDIEAFKEFYLNKKLVQKLPKDPIERRLIEIEYYTKKKFEELISELQKYIPLTFKSHTKYNLNNLTDTGYMQYMSRGCSNDKKSSMYNEDLTRAKISVASTEVIEQKSANNTAYKAFFPYQKHKPSIQIFKDKQATSFRQGAKTQIGKKKMINDKQISTHSKVNNIISEVSSTTYVDLSKVITHQPKHIPLINVDSIGFINSN